MSGTELILIGWKIVLMKNMFNVTTKGLPKEARESRKSSAAQGPHSEVVPRAF